MKNIDINTIYKAIVMCCLLTVSSHSFASLIYKFDNTDIQEVDFIGIEAFDVHLYFGPDKLDIGDSFDILIGTTPGASDYTSKLNVNFNLDEIVGFGFGGALNLTPLTEQFFITIVKQSGSFNLSGVTTYFVNNNVGASFHGVMQRPNETAQVPEPTSIILLLLAIGVMWLAVINNTYHNA